MIKQQALYRALVHTSLMVGFVAIAMLYVSYTLSGLDMDIRVLVVGFLEYLGIYTLNKGTDLREDALNHPGRREFYKGYPSPVIFGLVSCAVGLAIASTHNLHFAIFAAIPLLSVLFYGLPLIPHRAGFTRLKEVTVLKNAIVAFGWAAPVAFMPFAAMSLPFSLTSWAVFTMLFMMVFVNTVVFDMRDVYGDRHERVRTIPVVLGIRKTKILLSGLTTALALLVVYFWSSSILPSFSYLILANSIYTLVYLNLFGRFDSFIVCDILVDGEYLVLALIVLLGSTFMAA
jgi:4-hydroxybenzoate polyprenyltransferase